METNWRVLALSLYVLAVGGWTLRMPDVAAQDQSAAMCGSWCFDNFQQCYNWMSQGPCLGASVCDPDHWCCPGGVYGYCD
jgi:hypothetical protein